MFLTVLRVVLRGSPSFPLAAVLVVLLFIIFLSALTCGFVISSRGGGGRACMVPLDEYILRQESQFPSSPFLSIGLNTDHRVLSSVGVYFHRHGHLIIHV